MVFEEFSKNKFNIIIDLSLYKTDEEVSNPLAYFLKISYFEGDKNKISSAEDIKIIDEKFKKYTKTGTKTFQRSSSGNWFKNFVLRKYQFNGSVPFGTDPYTYTLKFEIYQVGF